MASWASKSWEPQGMSIGEVPVHPMVRNELEVPPQKKDIQKWYS